MVKFWEGMPRNSLSCHMIPKARHSPWFLCSFSCCLVHYLLQGFQKDSVGGKWFMMPRDGKCWVSRLEVPLHWKCVGNGNSPLGGLFNGFLNSVNIDPTKIWPEGFIIRGVFVNIMFVGPKNMLIGPNGRKRGHLLG